MAIKHPFQVVCTDLIGQVLFALVKNRLYVFDTISGAVIGSWVDEVDVTSGAQKGGKEKVAKNEQNDDKPAKKQKTGETAASKNPPAGSTVIYNYIRSLTLTHNEKYLIGTTDSDKAAVIFRLDYAAANCLVLEKRQTFPKRPCAVSASMDDENAVVADKFGDIYTIPIDNQPAVAEKTLAPLLGHVSMLSDVCVTQLDGKQFVLSADRDEHIRVSNYPKAYVVRSWLFGHNEFVSCLHVPSFDPRLLVSGGGDDYICVWRWHESRLLAKVQLRELVEKYLTEAHLPPARFLEESSPREIAITKILSLEVAAKRVLVVLVENTRCLLLFRLDEKEGSCVVEHMQTLELQAPLVDVALNGSGLLGALDVDSGQSLVEFYEFNALGVLQAKENGVSAKLTEANECEVETREEFYPLYTVNVLRKRSEH